MLLKPLTLAAAGLAAATQAFLLPPDLSTTSDVPSVQTSPDIVSLLGRGHVNLNVSCPGCLELLHTKGGHHGVGAAKSPAKQSHLEFDFSIAHIQGRDSLVVNGFPLYPIPDFSETLKAAVVPDGCVRSAVKELRGHWRRPLPPQELLYKWSVFEKMADPRSGIALYYLDLQVAGIDGTFVDGIPNVHIELWQNKHGDLAIFHVFETESKRPILKPSDEQGECTTFMCKWLATMKDNMAKMKGKCHGKMRGGAKGPRPHHEHHHHKGHPHKMEGDAHHRSWGQLFKNIAHDILLPVAVGIVAGVSVSLIGMVVGTLIVSVWRFFFRRPSHRRRHSRSHSHSHRKAPKAEVAAADVEEKSGLMEHQEQQDAPPSYDEEAVPTPPSYEENVAPKTDV